MRPRLVLAGLAAAAGLALAGCGSGTPSSTATTGGGTAGTTPQAAPPTTSAAASGGNPVCPTLAQAEAALGASYSSLVQNAAEGGGLVCDYTAVSNGTALVAIYAHQTIVVYDGQTAPSNTSPGMQPLSGVGDLAYGITTGGRSVVNAFSNSTRTSVAAQSNQSLAQTEAFAKVALADQ